MEPELQIRLHTLTKRQYLLVFCIFFAAFALTVIVGAIQHDVLSTATQPPGSPWSLTRINNTDSIRFSGVSPAGWSAFTQELWLEAVIHNYFYSRGDRHRLLKFVLRVVSLSGRDPSGKWTSLYPGLEKLRHSREVKCQQMCKPFTVLHLGRVSSQQYRVEFVMEDVSDTLLVENATMKWQYYNPKFTQLQIWSQFIFIVLTFIAGFQFLRSLKPTRIKDWCLEQRWLSVLLPLLILFNDPLFPLRYLVPQSWGERFIEVLFRTTFVCMVLLFWLCMLHAISMSERTFVSFYLPKILCVGMTWLAAITILSWQEYNLLSDPAYQLHLDTKSFTGWKIVFYVSIGIYLFFLGYVTFRAFGSQSPADVRLKFFSTLMFVVIVIITVLLLVHVGVTGLQPSFMSSAVLQYRNAAEFLTLLSVMNYYIFTLTFVYLPSKHALQDSDMKGDSSFRMLYTGDGEGEETIFSDSGFDQDDEFIRS